MIISKVALSAPVASILRPWAAASILNLSALISPTLVISLSSRSRPEPPPKKKLFITEAETGCEVPEVPWTTNRSPATTLPFAVAEPVIAIAAGATLLKLTIFSNWLSFNRVRFMHVPSTAIYWLKLVVDISIEPVLLCQRLLGMRYQASPALSPFRFQT